MKKIFPVIVVIGVLLRIVLGVPKVFTPSIDERIAKHAREANASLPMKVDGDTRLEKIVPGKSKFFSYHYTLVNTEFKDINPFHFRSTMKPRMKQHLMNTPEMHYLFKEGVTISYVYSDQGGTVIAKFDITPADLGF